MLWRWVIRSSEKHTIMCSSSSSSETQCSAHKPTSKHDKSVHKRVCSAYRLCHNFGMSTQTHKRWSRFKKNAAPELAMHCTGCDQMSVRHRWSVVGGKKRIYIAPNTIRCYIHSIIKVQISGKNLNSIKIFLNINNFNPERWSLNVLIQLKRKALKR